MSRDDALRAREIFVASLDEPPEARREFARRAAAGDRQLAEEVLSLLDVHERVGGGGDGPRIVASLPRIGPYRVHRPLGSGGMGTVFLCEQERPSRKVAVKLLHAPLDSPEAKRRFEVEAEALGRLSHRGIAHVYECGTIALQLFERPYIAMEHVDGVTLDRYVRESAPGLERRLGLASDICRAAHHAHEHGVIHRDLKPSNVIVAAGGIPKLIDFGIARLVDATLDGARTAAGAVLGSFGYMSPEQVRGAVGEVDRRADVYALGAIAYELAAGAPPIEIDTRNPAAAAVAIQERRPRPLPREVDPIRRRDLESVLFKALAKEREHRYDSAAELADELERVARFEPVRARRPSALHELGLFARRNRRLAASLAALAVVLVASVGAIAWLAMRESRAAERASDAAARANAAIDWVTAAVAAADPASTAEPDLTLRAVLDRGAADIPGQFESQPLVGAYLARVVGELYRRIGYPMRAEPLLRYALDTGARERGAADVETLRAEQALGSVLYDLGQLEEAEERLRSALRGRERELGPDAVETLESAGSLGNLLAASGRGGEAEPLLRRAFDGLARALGPDHDLTIDALDGLAVFLWERGALDEAAAMLRDGYERLRRTRGDGHPRTVLAAGSLGELLRARQRPGEAVDWLRAAIERARPSIGADHRALLLTRNNLAASLYENECLDEARAEYAEVVARRRATLGGEALDTLVGVTGLARALGELGHEAAAVAECERGLAESFDSSPEVARERTQILIVLATSYFVLQRPRAAYALASEAADRMSDDVSARADRCVVLGFLARLARFLDLTADAAAYEDLAARECGE